MAEKGGQGGQRAAAREPERLRSERDLLSPAEPCAREEPRREQSSEARAPRSLNRRAGRGAHK